jgi:hypothetical protein
MVGVEVVVHDLDIEPANTGAVATGDAAFDEISTGFDGVGEDTRSHGIDDARRLKALIFLEHRQGLSRAVGGAAVSKLVGRDGVAQVEQRRVLGSHVTDQCDEVV